MGAVAVFVLFGAVAVAMSASVRHDWRDGRQRRDRLTMWSAVEQVWPALLAATVAVVGPILILVNA